MSDKAYSHEPDYCPECGRICNRATLPEWLRAQQGIQARAPRPGDYSLCPECGAMNALDENLRRRKLTEKELEAIGPRARRLLQKLRGIMRKPPPHTNQ
jgi:hypothetical protein